MNGNLVRIEKELRRVAKHSKTIKYTRGLLFAFLMMGVTAFSAEVTLKDSDISKTKSSINTSVKSINDQFREARSINKKLLKNANLELVQLMEQGDQVVKSPWSSWQFGINVFTDEWQSNYEGHGDKKEKYPYEGLYVRNSDLSVRGLNPTTAAYRAYMLTNPTLSYNSADNAARTSASYGLVDENTPSSNAVPYDVTAAVNLKTVNRQPLVVAAPALPSGTGPAIPNVNIPTFNPAAPVVNTPPLFYPVDLRFTPTGFGQGSSPVYSPGNDQVFNNFDVVTADPSGTTINLGGGSNFTGAVTYSNGALTTTTPATVNLTSGVVEAFINVAGDINETVNGTFNYNNNNNTGTQRFISYNPYQVQNHKTVEFTGTLNLNGIIGGSTSCTFSTGCVTVGVEHQLLFGNGGGSSPVMLQASRGSTFENSGTINIAGKSTIGIMIDSEGTQSGYQSKTLNSGKINVGGSQNIGYDFGTFVGGSFITGTYTSGDLSGLAFTGHPNVEALPGEIIVDGTKNYGLRVQELATVPSTYTGGFLGPDYYEYSFIDGSIQTPGGVGIRVAGTENVGISFSQEMRRKQDPLYTPSSDYNVIDNVSHLNILVDGEKNIGILRRKDYLSAHSGKMLLGNDEVDSITFGANAKNSTLVRSDKFEIDLTKDVTVDKGISGNVVIHANGTSATAGEEAIAVNKATINLNSGSTGSGTILTGMISTNSGIIKNESIINVNEKNSIAMVVMAANPAAGLTTAGVGTMTGSSQINVTRENSIGVANFGTFTQTGGTIDVSGKDSIGVYAKDAVSSTLIQNSTVNSKDGAVGFYADGSAGNESSIKLDGVTSTVGDGGLLFFNYTSAGTTQVGTFDILSGGMTANVSSGGVAFYNRGIIGSEQAFLDMMSGNLTLNMSAGSRLFVFDNPGIVQDLSSIPGASGVGSITNAAGDGTVTVTGTGYKYTTANKATLNIDQNVNLDQATDNYYYVDFFSSNVNVGRSTSGIPTSAVMKNNGNALANSLTYAIAQKNANTTASSMTVTVDPTGEIKLTNQTGLVGIVTDRGTIINNGTVENSGESGVALLGANGSIITNNSILKMGNGGAGIMGINALPSGTVGDIDITNNGTITYAPTSSTVMETYGIVAKNDNYTTSSTVSNVTLGAGSLIDLTGSVGGVGVYASNSNIIDNGGDIKLGANGIGMQLVNPISIATTGGTITGDTAATNAIGMYIESGISPLTISKDITLLGDKSIGLNVKDTSGSMSLISTGLITIGDSVAQTNPGIGVYSDAQTITEQGTITAGKNSIGIYSSKPSSTVTLDTMGTITVGENGTGIYKDGGLLQLDGTLNASGSNSVGAYVINGGTITNNLTSFNIGTNAYGIVATGGTAPTNIVSNSSNVTMGDNSIFIYSSDASGTIINNSNVTSTSNSLYGLYGTGTIVNNGALDFSAGTGNIGIYTTGAGNATNNAIISIGDSNSLTNSYGIGMVSDSGSVARNSTAGTINVNGAKSIGMYATGAGSKVINDGVINLNTSQTTGMFIENGAEGINNGLITTTGTGTTQVTGVALKTGGILTNNGTININTDNGSGILNSNGVVANYGTITVSGTDTVVERVPSGATATAGGGSVTITVGGMATPTPGLVTITSAGVPITPVTVTLPSTPMTPSGPPTVAMYVDTSGLRYTTPMTSSTGTALATNLQIGTEVTEYTNAKAIKIDDPNIIIPYSTTAWKEVTSSSLTWVANRGLDLTSGLLNAFYLVKLPYTDFASDTNVYNFADGLEQRYGVEGLTSREKQLFNRLNSIGNNEQILLYQAYDEMMGHQYSNVQQRLFSTGNSLNKEFDYLSSEWATASKQSNKIKIFGMKGEYNTDTAGIIDYTNNTYGVAYLHENETIKLGSNTGWYAGLVQNRFDFKDIGGSEENTTMGKLGIFKTMAFDNNGSLTWKISGEGMFGYSQMDRKFLVVDEIFGAESTYTSYGVALRNEISKDIRLTERTSLKPYGSLAIEYGRFSDIKEKTGEMRLEVEGNDYYSIKPEVGVEYKYKQPLFLRSNLTASLGIAYENDLGKVNDAENRARVGYTDADYFNLRGEKENRTGNGKADLKIGIENSRVGLTLDLGYDTKGENVRGGMGLRIIY